jgi:hypothetical protein
MKKRTLVSVVVVLLMSAMAVAQYTTKQDDAKPDSTKASAQEKQAPKPATQTKTITGCLQKGDEPDEFSIVGEDGKVWGLRSSTVKLDAHLGHKVTVSGLITHESTAEETKEGKTEKASSKEEYGDLRVRSLKMVSETCGK